MNPKTKIIVGLSGGVDSAVSALLLKRQGYDVHGIFMQNWQVENDDPYCTAEQDLTDAKAAADVLQIPFQVVNFSKQYWENVFQRCLDEFSAGRTPNPDIWCNQEIKFKAFLEYALSLGADFLATGHYAGKKFSNNSYQLLRGKDSNKDQSYFLYTLTHKQLEKVLFPLAELQKEQVREIAREAGLLNCNKKDSTGICFIGERKFKDFLQEFLLNKPGPILTTTGQLLGQHQGLMYHTRGQRKGLNIGGQKNAAADAWYVIEKDLEKNALVVAQGEEHPLLYSKTLICDALTWVNAPPLSFPVYCSAKTRYRQIDQACTIERLSDQQCRVVFDEPQRAVTPGQSVVFYQNEICLGGGIIHNYQE
jgi:tRNA-specific 2-thiouridylase